MIVSTFAVFFITISFYRKFRILWGKKVIMIKSIVTQIGREHNVSAEICNRPYKKCAFYFYISYTRPWRRGGADFGSVAA